MSDLVRFSVSLEEDLLQEFDQYCKDNQLPTRSEAIRHLLREKLTTQTWQHDHSLVAANLTVVYDHHRSHLAEKMIELQHQHGDYVVATMHVHITHDLCMESIALRGPADELRTLSQKLGGLKGIHLSHLVVATAQIEDAGGSGGHSHSHGS
ncbi:MAG: nickel-responsive transcriptional regulator NikR [Zavarzinella sp.]